MNFLFLLNLEIKNKINLERNVLKVGSTYLCNLGENIPFIGIVRKRELLVLVRDSDKITSSRPSLK